MGMGCIMKTIKFLNVILLITILLISITMLYGGSVTVKSKGRAVTRINDDGSWESKCDHKDDTDCTITVILPDN
jgi:hypothetical protein